MLCFILFSLKRTLGSLSVVPATAAPASLDTLNQNPYFSEILCDSYTQKTKLENLNHKLTLHEALSPSCPVNQP